MVVQMIIVERFEEYLPASYTFFYRQVNFSSEPKFANEILENKPKGCFTVAKFHC